jgi:hypothetical protein
MPRVFILTSSLRFDLTPAKAWGEVHVLLPAIDLPAAHNAQRLVDALSTRLEELDFDPYNDLFALTGPSAQLAIALATVASLYGQLQLLIYDQHTQSYTKRDVEFPAPLLE